MKTKLVHVLVAIAMVFALTVAALPVVVQAVPPPPDADAGPDQLLMPTNPGAIVPDLMYDDVYLDGSGSFDVNDPITFDWEFMDWPGKDDAALAPALHDADTQSPWFSPEHGAYELQLTVMSDQMDVDYVRIFCGGGTWYVDDEVSSSNLNDGWTIPEAWRTITYAVENDDVVHGDTIMVLPGEYGGLGDVAENIVVDKALTIQSTEGREHTTINVLGQIDGDCTAVVEIEALCPMPQLEGGKPPPVVLDGFKLIGDCTGVFAHDSDEVQIINNWVNIPSEYGIGIGVHDCKFPVIDNNWIAVGGMDARFAVGIWLMGCLEAQVTNNTPPMGGCCDGDDGCCDPEPCCCPPMAWVNTHECAFAAGIIAWCSPKSLIQYNCVPVKVGNDAWAFGIWVSGSPFVQILDNGVCVELDGYYFGEAYGIVAWFSDYADVGRNCVDVEAEVSFNCGYVWAEGIDVWFADFSEIFENQVYVWAFGRMNGDFNNRGMDPALLQELGDLEAEAAQVMEQRQQAIQEITTDVTGMCPDAFGGALGVGIWVGASINPVVHMNDPVDVDVELQGRVDGTVEEPAMLETILGAALGGGIMATFSDGAEVHHNVVTADAMADLMAKEIGWVPPGPFPPEQDAHSLGFSAGLGIVLLHCLPYIVDAHQIPVEMLLSNVSENSVEANGNMTTKAEAESQHWVRDSVPGTPVLTSNVGSVLDAVFEAVNETVQSEEVDGPINGQPMPMGAYAESLGAGIGIGILTIACPGVQVVANHPVVGIGMAWVTSLATDYAIVYIAEAWGGGLGMGAGIVSISCPYTAIEGNAVLDYGFADALVGAYQIPIDRPIAMATGAFGGGAGVGVGIIVIDLGSPHDAWHGPPGPPALVAGNYVISTGEALVEVEADADVFDEDALAFGGGIGAGLGIAVVLVPGAVVAENHVNAYGNTTVIVRAEAISDLDPMAAAFGGGLGTGVGIIALMSDGIQIVNNTVKCFECHEENGSVDVLEVMDCSGATGKATVDVYAREDWTYPENDVEPMAVKAHAGGLGVGLGIVVARCNGSAVYSEGYIVPDPAGPEDLMTQDVIARGWAWVNSIAHSEVPLACVANAALGAGIGVALVVMCSWDVDVGPCNVLDGAGEVYVYSEVMADPLQIDIGLALGLDMLWLMSPNGTANYNSLVGVGGSYGVVVGMPPEYSYGHMHVIDWGLLSIGPSLDARYNWWADPTGPGGFGPGNGQWIVWCGCDVDYEPWLYVPHTYCVWHHEGKFGFAIRLHKCWNTFSTPIPLEQRVDHWGELLAFSGVESQVDIAYWWDEALQQWDMVLNGDPVDPLYGMYVKMNADGTFLLLTDDREKFPTRGLLEGYNLIGPNPPFFDEAIFVEDAVSSIEGAPGQGYAFVMSPGIGMGPGSQPTWVWSGTPGIPDCPCMLSGFAYWVWMDTADTLAGFGFTPVRTLFPERNNPCNNFMVP